MRRFVVFFSLVFGLTACVTPEANSELGKAVTAPARDFNIVREKIPDILEDMETPYGPVRAGCKSLTQEINDLSNVLGVDYDEIPLTDEKEKWTEKAEAEASNALVGGIEGITTDFIPFRSLVRRATGATKYESRVRRAYQLGLMRRAYLKGRGQVLGCEPPGSPYKEPPKPEELTMPEPEKKTGNSP